jgi:thiosulfate reductase cytochrome b subunit
MSAGADMIHPAWLRVTHWINVVAVFLMVMSGWKIYNASPIFDFVFPKEITLGGWLGGALLWHFFAMWILALNGLSRCKSGDRKIYAQIFPASPQRRVGRHSSSAARQTSAQ